ncbi:unnamed protein product [Paramecium primaurelia]|uniref:PDZ GRASP-type domain-containing protein n=1 Tax=Paramecium primaurelia TaxID=5886 RepID=A0A8S1PUG0_PARPR|nr:unnamed protein product [Paramecium primaurelia]
MGNNSSQIGNGYGYRIISIEPNSFGSNLNLEIFLDYIIHIKSNSQVNSIKLLESDEPIELSIFNIFSLETRKIYISEPRSTIKLGLFIRYESINPLILHITKVLNGSPAEASGLKSNQDYLLGVKSHRYQSIDEFSDIVTGQAYTKQSIELCIFSPLTKKSPRIVILNPKYNWGGPGALGCEFASGALHSFNFSQLIKQQEDNEFNQVLNNEEEQLNEESNQYQQIENQEQNDIIQNNQQNQQSELNKSIQIDNTNDTQEHSINQSQNIINQQINESKQNSNIEVQYQNQEISDFKQQQQNTILTEQDNQQKQNQDYEQIQSNILQSEKLSNLRQQDDDGEIKEELRIQNEQQQQQQQQQQQLEKEENDSLQQQNAQSNLEQNKNEIQDVQSQSDICLQNNDQKHMIVESGNQIVFKSPNRDEMYVVDKQLLFDIQFEVPKYYVNIY